MAYHNFYFLVTLFSFLTVSSSKAADKEMIPPTQISQPTIPLVRTQVPGSSLQLLQLQQSQVIPSKDLELTTLSIRLPKYTAHHDYKNKCYLELIDIHQETTYQFFMNDELYLIKFAFAINPKDKSDSPLSHLYEHRTLGGLFNHFYINLHEDMTHHPLNPISQLLLEKEKSSLMPTSSLPAISQSTAPSLKKRKTTTPEVPPTRGRKKKKIMIEPDVTTSSKPTSSEDAPKESELTTSSEPLIYNFTMNFRNPRGLGLTSISVNVEKHEGPFTAYHLPYLKDKLDAFIMKPCFNLVYFSIIEAITDIQRDITTKDHSTYHL
jgi:hypothetical protein